MDKYTNTNDNNSGRKEEFAGTAIKIGVVVLVILIIIALIYCCGDMILLYLLITGRSIGSFFGSIASAVASIVD